MTVLAGRRIVGGGGQFRVMTISQSHCAPAVSEMSPDDLAGMPRPPGLPAVPTFGVGLTDEQAAQIPISAGDVRVARRLAVLPPLAEAMDAGRLSFSKVRAITRIVEDPDDPALYGLLDIAENGTTAHLESVVSGLRTCDRNELADAARRAGVSHHPDGDPHGQPTDQRSSTVDTGWVTARWNNHSAMEVHGQLPDDAGAVVLAALDAAKEDLRHHDADPDSGDRFAPSMADALVALAENYLADRETGTVRSLAGHERAAIIVHLDVALVQAAVCDDTTGDTPPDQDSNPTKINCSAEPSTPSTTAVTTARIDHGPALTLAAVRRLMCNARIRTVIRTGTAVLDVGRSRRVVSDTQFRALLLRDQGCRAPGCGSRTGLQAHHLEHWADGGRTDMANLVLLCRRHHRLHHDGVITIGVIATNRASRHS